MTKLSARSLIGPLVVALALALVLGVSGCKKQAAETEEAPTASGYLPVAESAVETSAPDARLLLAQAAGDTRSPNSTVWTYVFGSPESGKMYSVSVSNGTAMGVLDAGMAPLQDSEWASVPETGSWTIDSDEAYAKAVEASGIEGEPTEFSMLLNTYTPKSSETGAKAMVWYVSLSTGTDTGDVIQVDAKSGEATKVP